MFFDTVEGYIGVFEPLLFEEVKAQIVQGKDEEEAMDWQGAISSCDEADEFHKLSLAILDDFRDEISENNLLLLSMEKGPPETGKTQTILGLLSVILHSSPPRVHSSGGACVKRRPAISIKLRHGHWRKAPPWLTGLNPRDLIRPIDGDDGFYPVGNELKPEIVKCSRKYRTHVLVCSPSNSALDEMVMRVLRTGIHDESNRVYNPKIVRIGLNLHDTVQAVSMDYLVEQKLASMDRPSSAGGKSGRFADRDKISASILDESLLYAPLVQNCCSIPIF